MNRQDILAEIRRTAAENGGKPLGKERFYRETGINEADWLGKYWARWSDAIRETGLEPNQMQGAHDEHVLIEHYISLMRELDKFPTSNEVKLKARNAPGFPWHNTFARFGSKQQLAKRIQEYCNEREGYGDIVALCAVVINVAPTPPEDDVEEAEVFGFVYLIKASRYYKIGRSNAVGRREYELGIQLPEKALTIHSIRTDDPIGIEAYWHKRFEAKHKNGEWFDLSSADVKAFKRRKFM
jgi:hypothetical protein